jgi:hypothetical protein
VDRVLFDSPWALATRGGHAPAPRRRDFRHHGPVTDTIPLERDPDQQPAVAGTEPPTPGDLAWTVAITATKATVIALAIDAFLNSAAPRYHGKGMRLRAVGYALGMSIVPVAWRMRGRPEPYPRGLDLAITLPLLVDAGGNAVGIYRRAHVDDLIHFADGAILSAVVGALATPRVRTSWEAAGAGAAAGAAAAGIWEIGEWIGLKLGAKGMDLTYDDTMTDLIETMAGAVLGGAITLLRHPARLRRIPGTRADPVIERHHVRHDRLAGAG